MDAAGLTSPVIDLTTEHHRKMDALEVEMMRHPAVSCGLVHRFTPGMYSREITMPAGAIITSKIHRFEHQYIVTRGRLSVWTDEGRIDIEAPFHGITKPGTRRVLQIHEETVWTTFHLTERTDLAEIEAEIIVPHSEHRAGLVQPTQDAPAIAEGAASCRG